MLSRWIRHALLRESCRRPSCGLHHSAKRSSMDSYTLSFSSTLSDSVDGSNLFQASFRRSPHSIINDSAIYLAEQRASVRLNHNTQEVDDIQQKIHAASNLRELLSIVRQPGFFYLHACSVLKYLGDWVTEKKASAEDVRSDLDFQYIVDTVVKKAEILPPFYLMLALRGIREVGVEGDTYPCQTLQTSLRWKMRQMNMNLLISLFVWQMDNLVFPLDNTVLEEVRSTILRRWVEITDPAHALVLFSRTPKAGFTEEFVNKLEDTLVDLSAMMSTDDLVLSLVTMSKLRKRSLPLLRSVTYHLTRKHESLTPSQAVRILRACTTVKFIDDSLLGKTADSLLPQVASLSSGSSSTVRAILISVRFLNWKRKDLLRALEKWMLKHKKVLCDRDIQALLMALSSVNHQPTDGKELLQLVDSLLPPHKQELGLRLDIVWSLVALGLARSSDVTSLIAEPMNSLSEVQQKKFQQILQWQKIVNKDPNEKLDSILQSIELSRTKSKHSGGDLSDSVREALAQFIPRPKYLSEKVRLDDGLYLDAEFVMNSHGDPVPRDKWATSTDSKRFGVRVLDYWSICVGSSELELTGQANLTTSLLEQKGYTILHVPFTEFSVRDRTLAKVQYLQRKLEHLTPKKT